MTALGKSLVFYFKFWYEMQRLCESEDADLEGVELAARSFAREGGLADSCSGRSRP